MYLLICLFFKISVCIGVLNKFRETLPKDSLSDPKKIESAFKVYCKDLKLRENRFVS